MSKIWLGLLESLGKPVVGQKETTPTFYPQTIKVGAWYEFLHYQILFELYGPPPDSPWYPYHCPTIFAAIDRRAVHPGLSEISPEIYGASSPALWQWLDSKTMVILDMVGGLSVQLGVKMNVEAGAQLISAFDHWPAPALFRMGQKPLNPDNQSGMSPKPWPPMARNSDVVVDSQDVVDLMVTLAPAVYARRQSGISPAAPPVWMCDSRRSAATKPGPGKFDNRYYIDDSILPTPEKLRAHGIEKIVYFSAMLDTDPVDDLNAFLVSCNEAGIMLFRSAFSDSESWGNPGKMLAPPKRKFRNLFYPKADMGGFGVMVPAPSEGSGGSYGRSYGGSGG